MCKVDAEHRRCILVEIVVRVDADTRKPKAVSVALAGLADIVQLCPAESALRNESVEQKVDIVGSLEFVQLVGQQINRPSINLVDDPNTLKLL